MKKINGFIILFLSSPLLFPQTVVKSNDFHYQGTSIIYFLGNSIGEVNKNGGPDQIWDLSKMKLEQISDALFVNPSETKYAHEFPSATLAYEATIGSGDYTYLKLKDDELEYLGFCSSNNSIPVICKYSNTWKMYQLPLHLNDSDSDSFSSSSVILDDGDTIYNFFKGEYKYHVDGFGTLITPFKKYPNTFRIQSITEGTDSSVRVGKSDTTIVSSYITKKDSWISPDGDKSFEQASTFDFKDFYFSKTKSAVSVNDDKIYSKDSVYVYPNPAFDRINIKIPNIVSNSFVLILYNNQGTILKNDQVKLINKNAADYSFPVDDLSPGIYFVLFKFEKYEWSAKFIKQ